MIAKTINKYAIIRNTNISLIFSSYSYGFSVVPRFLEWVLASTFHLDSTNLPVTMGWSALLKPIFLFFNGSFNSIYKYIPAPKKPDILPKLRNGV